MSKMLPEEELGPALRAYAQAAVPDQLDWWPTIQRRLRQAAPPPRFQLRRPTTRLGWAALVIAALLTVSTAAYAADAVMNQVYRLDPAFRPLATGRPIGLSQTLNGYTVTLQQAYVDQDQIIIGYTIDGAESGRLAPYGLSLRDATGRAFHPQLGAGHVPGAGTSGYALTFRAGALDTQAVELKLHLSVSLVKAVPGGAPPPMIAPVIDGQVPAPVASPAGLPLVAGPFNFDFSVPLEK